MNTFMAVKRAECDRFNAEPTALDHAWYLKQA
jgi:glutamine synthetase